MAASAEPVGRASPCEEEGSGSRRLAASLPRPAPRRPARRMGVATLSQFRALRSNAAAVDKGAPEGAAAILGSERGLRGHGPPSRRVRDAVLSPFPEGGSGAARPSVLSEGARPSHLSAQRPEVPVRPGWEMAPGLGCVRPRLLAAVVPEQKRWCLQNKKNQNSAPFPLKCLIRVRPGVSLQYNFPIAAGRAPCHQQQCFTRD